MNRAIVVLIVLGLLASPCLAQADSSPAPDDFKPPEGLPQGWYARIETSMGRLIVRLMPEQAPQSVAYFVGLAQGTLQWNDPVTGEPRSGRYYDGAEFYKAQAGRLLEAGDRNGEGAHAPFFYVPPEGFGPVNFDIGYRVGNVPLGPRFSAARFFITAAAFPGMTGNAPCFGVVLKGYEKIFDMTAVKTQRSGRPVEPIVIEKIRIFTIGKQDPLPTPERYFPQPQERIKVK